MANHSLYRGFFRMRAFFLLERNDSATTASGIGCKFPIAYTQAHQRLVVNSKRHFLRIAEVRDRVELSPFVFAYRFHKSAAVDSTSLHKYSNQRSGLSRKAAHISAKEPATQTGRTSIPGGREFPPVCLPPLMTRKAVGPYAFERVSSSWRCRPHHAIARVALEFQGSLFP